MIDTQDSWGEAAHWYPDIVAAGDLRHAWQAEFDRAGHPLQADARQGQHPHRTATVRNGEVHADLLLNPWKRQIHLALRNDGATLLQGHAADLATAAEAARLWLSGARPGQVAAAWPFLGSVALAQARERGDHREASWLWLHENHCADPIGLRLRAFVNLAFHEPRLRALHPYTSHWTLHLSRTAHQPFNQDLPAIVPAQTPDRYTVHTRDRRHHEETDAAGTLRILLNELPR